MLSKYGNCTRLLKIKNKLKIGLLFLQIKPGRILDILWVFLINKTIIPLTLVEYEMIVAITRTLYPHCIPEPHNHIIIVKRYERVAE